MKTEIFHKAKNGRVIKRTHTKGINIGDYVFVVFDSQNVHVETFGNRSFRAAISKCNSL